MRDDIEPMARSGRSLEDIEPDQFVVYLAGKTWAKNFTDQNKWHVATKAAHQLSGRTEFIASDGWKGHGWHDAEIYAASLDDIDRDVRAWTNEFCISLLHRADMLFAWLNDDTSYGSIAEIAYFSALGKPIVIAALVAEPEIDCEGNLFSEFNSGMSDTYWLCSSFPGVVLQTVSSADAAANVLAGFIEGLQVGINKRGALVSTALQRLQHR